MTAKPGERLEPEARFAVNRFGRGSSPCWEAWRPGRADPPLWQHDLFHDNHKPYDSEEIELFRKTILAARQQRE